MKSLWKILALAFLALPVLGADTTEKEMTEAPALNWDAAPVDLVLQTYGEQVGKTILKDPQVPNVNITLKSREGQKLSVDEYLEAIEVVLEMNGIHLEPYGESFIRALPRREVRKEGIPLFMDPAAAELDRNPGVVVSVMINFKNISYEEAQKALEGFKSNSGILLCFERTNSILVTDTKHNISRMMEIAKSIDVATPVTENVFVRQIQNANAADIQKALQTIVEDSQKELEKAGKGVQNATSNSSSSSSTGRNLLNRNKKDESASQVSNESLIMNVSDADRGMIRGKVLILSDERSNKLIIVTSKANMDFFDNVISQLDVETTPDVKVEVIRLKYADAEDVADMINDLIGNTSSSSSKNNNQNQNAKAGTSGNLSTKTTKPVANNSASNGESKAGELTKENVTVLADKRINGLVIMARAVDMPILHQIINAMDIKLAQVLIETVIVEVALEDEIKTGIDWLKTVENNGQGLSGGGGDKLLIDKVKNIKVTDAIQGTPQGSAGIGYFAHIKDLNLSAIITASKTDNKSKYLASPVIMTVDNKEAVIDATTKRKFISSWQTTSSSYSGSGMPTPAYESEDIGIKVKVKPKINPNGTVMLEVEEEYTQVNSKQSMLVPTDKTYENKDVDIPTIRKMSSDVILEHKQTIVFGGLIENKIILMDAGIPILKDIPYVGRYLFGKTEDKEVRTELLVFMTPYVLDDASSAQIEAARRKSVLSDARPWQDNGWSQSELADPVAAKELLRRQGEEWKSQDEEHDAARKLDNAKLERAIQLEERAKKESEEESKDKGEESGETDPAGADQ